MTGFTSFVPGNYFDFLGPGKECESHTVLRKAWVCRKRREETGRGNVGVSCSFEEKVIAQRTGSYRNDEGTARGCTGNVWFGI